MAKVKLKTASRNTKVSRKLIRDAVTGVFSSTPNKVLVKVAVRGSKKAAPKKK